MRFHRVLAAAPALYFVGVLAGCQQHSHTVSHSYEYSERGQVPVHESEVVQEPPTSEYRMVSPGEMTSPGEMASPGRMVVEPRRP